MTNHHADFESTFAPEIAAFTPPRPIRPANATPSPSWPRSPLSAAHTPTLQQPLDGAKLNGVIAEDEVSVVQPVQLRQGRGARLSFLGGRKKDNTSPQHHQQQQSNHPTAPPIPQTNGGDHHHHVNGDAESATSGHSRAGRENPNNNSHNRLSFFRSNSNTLPPDVKVESVGGGGGGGGGGKHHEWVVEHALGPRGTTTTTTPAPGRRKSSDITRTLSVRDGADPAGLLDAAGGERKVGNVRKRLSMLKLGKKSSKGNVLMGSLDEE
jgi:hypothetical protein